MLLVLDNYDSFTFNLVQAFRARGDDVQVVRNDAMTLAQLKRLKPDKLVVSPGPGLPQTAGVSMRAIAYFAGRLPLLGVCLGHQALGLCFGARLVRAARPMHGKVSRIEHRAQGLLADMAQPFVAMRYHSWLVEKTSLQACWELEAWTEAGEVMALRHKATGAWGIQFHPESVGSPRGERILQTFARQ